MAYGGKAVKPRFERPDGPTVERRPKDRQAGRKNGFDFGVAPSRMRDWPLTVVSTVKGWPASVSRERVNWRMSDKCALGGYAETNRGQPSSETVVGDLPEHIQITHHRLKAGGTP